MSHTLLAGLGGADWSGMLIALLQVLMIDLVLAGDNAVAVGIAASGLHPDQRKRVILAGLSAAVVLRIAFALAAQRLLNLIGLQLAGGLILLFVGWKMWRDLRANAEARRLTADPPAKTFWQAFLQIFLADLAMSLDNVLAVAGAALRHPFVLIFGLVLSIGLMGVAANAIAAVLHRARWISYVGLLVVIYVALHMIWEGYRGGVVDLGQTKAYNDLMPGAWLDIKPDEAAKHLKKK
jgi:YjbE family integral membrane protein